MLMLRLMYKLVYVFVVYVLVCPSSQCLYYM